MDFIYIIISFFKLRFFLYVIVNFLFEFSPKQMDQKVLPIQCNLW